MKKLLLIGLFLAASLRAEAPKDLTLVRVITRTAVVFKAADLKAPRKGRVQFRDTFELLDDQPENGFWKVQFTDGPGYILAADSQRTAAPSDPSYKLSAVAAGQGLSPTGQSANGEAYGAGLAPTGRVPKALQDLQRLPPKPKGDASGPRPHPDPPATGQDPAAPAAGAAGGARPVSTWYPEALPTWMFYVPLGWGVGGAAEPAFRPTASAPVSRGLEGAFSWGLGVERRALPWLSVYGQWELSQYQVHAADRGLPAFPQGLSSSASLVFPDYGLDYRLQSHAFSLGLRAGAYYAPLRPWAGVAISEHLWSAQYLDADASKERGQASGQALGLDLALGLDIYVKLFGAGVAKVTPMVNFLTPLASPQIKDVGGSGLDWNDRAGSPVRAPVRFGVQLGLGF